MPPVFVSDEQIKRVDIHAAVRNGTSSTSGAYDQHVWTGGLNVASVDLIAMVVSDAGLASTEPQWWNASPIGCVLLGLQPRGGWQVMQRAVQWGTDHWAHCFGVSCKVPILYAYFACSIRNRLEVWQSERFTSPMEESQAHSLVTGVDAVPTNEAASVLVREDTQDISSQQMAQEKAAAFHKEGIIDMSLSPKASPVLEADDISKDTKGAEEALESEKIPNLKPEKQGDIPWNEFDRGIAGKFAVQRPTKLMDGSRGGQAFMCALLCPESGKVYSVEEQARLQLLSVMLVVAGLLKTDSLTDLLETLRVDFEISNRLGFVFYRLARWLFLANLVVLGFTTVVFYALWKENIFGGAAPYIIQLCSLASWASGATGLMMLGGNPRVVIDQSKPAPKHVQEKLAALPEGYVNLAFGSLHGSVYIHDRGECHVPSHVVKAVCGWRLFLERTWLWHVAMAWFSLFLIISITLQIAGSRVKTLRSEILSIFLLISTSVLRGAGVSGPEDWMIPKWRRREGASYSVKLQGQIASRASIGTEA